MSDPAAISNKFEQGGQCETFDEFITLINGDRLDINMEPDGKLKFSASLDRAADVIAAYQFMQRYPVACNIAFAYFMIMDAAKIEWKDNPLNFLHYLVDRLKPYEHFRSPSRMTQTAYDIFNDWNTNFEYPADYPAVIVEFARQFVIAVNSIRSANDTTLASRRPVKAPAGYVYLIKNTDGLYKIGTTRQPTSRLKTFKLELPFDVSYEHLIGANDAYYAESVLQTRYKAARIRGEWFQLSPDQVEEIKQIRWL